MEEGDDGGWKRSEEPRERGLWWRKRWWRREEMVDGRDRGGKRWRREELE